MFIFIHETLLKKLCSPSNFWRLQFTMTMKIESQGFEDIEPIAFIPFVYEDFVDSECIVEAIMYPPLKSEQTLTVTQL